MVYYPGSILLTWFTWKAYSYLHGLWWCTRRII